MNLTTQFPVNEIFKETAETLSLAIYENGEAATVSSPSYKVYDSSGIEKGSGTPSVNNNTLTVTITDSMFKDLQEDCFIEWIFTVSEKQFKVVEYFDVVKRKVYCNVIDSDLQKYYPDLGNKLWSSQSNYDNQIQLAWRDVQLDIKNRGNRINLIPNDSAIKKLIELKAFTYIFEAFIREDDDTWDDKRERAEEKYREQFNNTQFRYDVDEDLTIDLRSTFGNIQASK